MKVISKQRTFSICRQKNPGFHAKWNCRDQFWPGVAPCEGQVEKKWVKLAETKNWFFQRHQKNYHFSLNFYRKNNICNSVNAQQRAKQNMSAVAWRSEQPNLRYLPSKSKNSHFCPSDTENCVFGQQSRRFEQNVSRTKFLLCVQEAVCQFLAESVGNFSKSSEFTP